MPGAWEEFIDRLKDESGKLAKAELKELVNNSKTDSEQFIKEQGQKMERYLNQLATGEITKTQFEGYMVDIRELTRMKERELSVAAKAKAQKIVMGITDYIINGLVALL